MATDEPEADDAAADPMDDDADDAGDAGAAMHSSNGSGGKPGKKRVSEEFRQKVRCALVPGQDIVVWSTVKERRSLDAHRAQSKVQHLRTQVLGILQQNDFEDARVAKMGQDDILRLLACFNAAGIHFA
jgi:hypothetical protein